MQTNIPPDCGCGKGDECQEDDLYRTMAMPDPEPPEIEEEIQHPYKSPIDEKFKNDQMGTY